MLIKFIAEKVTQVQIDWAGNADPAGLLVVGQEYELDYADVRSQSTRIFLKDFPGKQFNSVWFDIDDVRKLPKPGSSEAEKDAWITAVTRHLYGTLYTTQIELCKAQYYQSFEESWSELVYSGKLSIESYNASWKKCMAGVEQIKTLAASDIFENIRTKYGEDCAYNISAKFFGDVYTAVVMPPTPSHLNDRAHVALCKHRSGVGR